MKTIVTLFAIICIVSAIGCDPLDDASTRGVRVGGNRYFEATDNYPEYYIVEYMISGYKPEKLTMYFRKSLELAQPVLTNTEANPRKEKIHYVVVVLVDVDPSRHAATYDECLPAARLFNRADIIAPNADFQTLVEKTLPEQPPFYYPVAPGSMTVGGPIIVRHAKSLADKQAATRSSVMDRSAK